MTNRQYRRCRVTAQSTWEKSVASIVDAWVCRNFRHVVPERPLRCRGNLQRLQDPADRRRADPVAELEQLALDPLVSPAIVRRGEPLDQPGDLGAGWRPSRPVRVGPLAVTRRRCQRRTVPGATSRCARSLAGRSRVGAARTARSAQSRRGRGLTRRSTATSCRSTSSSAFFDVDERPSRTSQPQIRTRMR